MRSPDKRPFAYSPLGVAILSSLGFILMTLLVVSGATLGVDAYLQQAGSPWRQGELRQIADFGAFLGSSYGLVPVAGFATLLLITRRRFALALLPFLSMVGSTAANQAVKCAVGRTRPSGDVWDAAITSCDRFSFPSGHAMESMALYGLLALLVLGLITGRQRVATAAVLILLPLAIGMSRVALGVHWMSDVAGGWLAGLLVASVAMLLWQRAERLSESQPPVERAEGFERNRSQSPSPPGRGRPTDSPSPPGRGSG